MADILIVGAADTGRAPMAAALLLRLLEQRSLVWRVGSAGVLGHDDDPPEVEARDTMAHLGLDISDHRARSIDEALAGEAALLLAIDSGAARVLRARFPNLAPRVFTLGELAGRPRDIPDPFRMQIGAWMTYARELEALLGAALSRMGELVEAGGRGTGDGGRETGDGRQGTGESERGRGGEGGTGDGRPERGREGDGRRGMGEGETGDGRRETGEEFFSPQPQAPSLKPPAPGPERLAAVERVERLLRLAADMPGVVDWPAALRQIEADLAAATTSSDPADLAPAYGGVLRAALALSGQPPSAGQLAALGQAVGRLAAPVGTDDLTWLSGQLASWPTR